MKPQSPLAPISDPHTFAHSENAEQNYRQNIDKLTFLRTFCPCYSQNNGILTFLRIFLPTLVSKYEQSYQSESILAAIPFKIFEYLHFWEHSCRRSSQSAWGHGCTAGWAHLSTAARALLCTADVAHPGTAARAPGCTAGEARPGTAGRGLECTAGAAHPGTVAPGLGCTAGGARPGTVAPALGYTAGEGHSGTPAWAPVGSPAGTPAQICI